MKMQFVPYNKLGGSPNIIVDGAPNQATRLTLSHWPHSGTPWPLKDDLSAQIVFKYLEHPDFHLNVQAVSNNHFDEDGLISLFAILNPQIAEANKELLIDIAAAGDFGIYHLRDAARIAFVISAFGDAETSPLPAEIFRRPYSETTAALYQQMLMKVPEMLSNPEKFQEYWQDEEQRLEESESAIRNGRVRIEEIPTLDLAIVYLPDGFDLHQFALHNATDRFRILKISGRKYELKFRYETWVQYVSKRPMQRVDLNPLAKTLSDEDDGTWEFDGVDTIIPALLRSDGGESRIVREAFRKRIEKFLADASPAWDPFDR